jgi:hypothetical protein
MTFWTSVMLRPVSKLWIAPRAIGDGAETIEGWQRPDRGRSRYALQRPILGVARTNFSIFSVDCGAVNGKLLSGAGGQLVSPRTSVGTAKKRARVVLASVIRACVGDYGFATAG